MSIHFYKRIHRFYNFESSSCRSYSPEHTHIGEAKFALPRVRVNAPLLSRYYDTIIIGHYAILYTHQARLQAYIAKALRVPTIFAYHVTQI